MSELLIKSAIIGHKEPTVYEKMNGRLILMSRPNQKHIAAADNLTYFLKGYCKKTSCRMYSEMEVYLGEDTVIPDLCVVCNLSLLNGQGVEGAPDLIVEVLSRSTKKRDTGYKKDLYEKHGVKEYWIVDPYMRSLSQFVLENGKYTLHDEYICPYDWEYERLDDEQKAEINPVVTSVLFPELTFDLNEVFED